MLSDDPLGDGQTEPGPFRLGGEKGLKDAFKILSRNPYPLIIDHKPDGMPVAVGREPNLPTLRGGMKGILEQVDQGLPDFFGIQAHWCSGLTLANEVNSAVSELVVQHPIHLLNELADLHLFSLER